MQLRRFGSRDLARVYELACSSLSENYNPALFLDLYNYWPEGFIVAEEDGRITGFIFGIMMSKTEARILMLAVDPRYRGKGCGSVLYREMQRQCAIKGMRMIALEVRVSNQVALHFYEKMGFQIVGRIPNYYSNSEDAFRMQLFL